MSAYGDLTRERYADSVNERRSIALGPMTLLYPIPQESPILKQKWSGYPPRGNCLCTAGGLRKAGRYAPRPARPARSKRKTPCAGNTDHDRHPA